MARYTKDQFLSHLAAYSTGMTIGRRNTANFLKFAAKSGIRLAGIGARRAAVPAARGIGAIVRRNPYAFAGLTLYEAERRGLLDEPKERAQDAAARALFEAGEFLPDRTPQQMIEDFQGLDVGPAPTRTKKLSSYNKAVKLGMARIKGSKTNGKRGTISKPQAAFKTVNQVASRMFGKKKVPRTGLKGKIATAIKKGMPKSTWTVKVRK